MKSTGGNSHKMLSRYLHWLSCSINLIEERLQFLIYVVSNRHQALRCLSRLPHLLSYDVDTMITQVRTLKIYGFDPLESSKIIERSVSIFSMNVEDNLGPSIHYFLNEVGFSFHSITSSPAILTLSLRSRSIPRHKEQMMSNSFYSVVSREKFFIKQNLCSEGVRKKNWHFVRKDYQNRYFSRSTIRRQL